MKKLLPLLSILLLSLTACGSNGEVAQKMRSKGEVPQYTANKPAGKDQGVVRNNMENQNPNFLNLNNSEPGSSAYQENDIDKAREVINATEEFKPGRIAINGNEMWITVYKKGMLNADEKIDAEARIHKKLVQALPRYNIEVKVKEDRR
ncbi:MULTISPECIES: hypothetical protein [unclassified Bacillus (in: firmicutes)]|uniref:hypothetical protein n=1 Tax=unclassified Bacillus (in: firmicutes) TaxID=185979 RepID=UPI0008E32CE9|nr:MULTISPECIES: hypothetical protein [unclassified Bacillus (in: firmicutes)]SFB03644.1 hypothetical protein SAMN02799634_104209 [Bacillus sp. UNCCL13]SFQ88746.1 hypothetical protein SAMN04488577_3304 [Bacillus sp. cl95]